MFSVFYNTTIKLFWLFILQKIEEVAKHGELFEEAVETFPKTIACRNQNQPLGSFYWPSSSEWNTPSLDKYKMGMRKLKLPSGYESKLSIV